MSQFSLAEHQKLVFFFKLIDLDLFDVVGKIL